MIFRNKRTPALAPRPKTIVEQVEATLAQAREEEASLVRQIDILNERLVTASATREKTERIANGLDSVLTGVQ